MDEGPCAALSLPWSWTFLNNINNRRFFVSIQCVLLSQMLCIEFWDNKSSKQSLEIIWSNPCSCQGWLWSCQDAQGLEQSSSEHVQVGHPTNSLDNQFLCLILSCSCSAAGWRSPIFAAPLAAALCLPWWSFLCCIPSSNSCPLPGSPELGPVLQVGCHKYQVGGMKSFHLCEQNPVCN